MNEEFVECPHCGESEDYYWHDLWELGEDDYTEVECGNCGEKFEIYAEIQRYYLGRKIK